MKPLVVALVFVLSLGVATAPAREANFLPDDRADAHRHLPSPPREGSREQEAELAELHRIEATRSREDVARAQADAAEKSIFLFASVFGDEFTRENLPALGALSSKIADDAGTAIAATKKAFHRPRPYKIDETLHPVCRMSEIDDSYPSGHTTLGYLLALTLIDMVPQQRDALLARADAYGRSRLVCGVHYPSDVAAGRLAAYALHAEMARDPRYREALATASAELRQALGSASAD